MDPDISLPTASPIAAQPIARSRSWRCRRHTGTSPGEFHNPYGIAVDGNGFIYVSDNMNNRIQRLNPDGSAGEIWNTQTFDDKGIDSPAGMAVDSAGDFYATDTFNHRVMKFSRLAD